MIKNEFFKQYHIHDNTALIDIETSGLSHIDDDILIISVAKFFDEKKTRVIQLISENDERTLILEFLTVILGIYEIYSFNGYEFEERFIREKTRKYNINFDFSSIKFISCKSILKHYSTFWNIKNFSRQEIENHFKIERKNYYDIKLITKDIKKNKLICNNDLINHNIDEIDSLLELNYKIYKLQTSKKEYISGEYFYVYDFEISFEKLRLYFKSETNRKYSQFFMQNGEILIVYKNNIDMEIFVKTLYDNNKKIVLYETENEYIPIFIEKHILYENIYHILAENIKSIL